MLLDLGAGCLAFVLTHSKELLVATATLTSKGQVTIPREVRASLGVGAGDRLDFVRLEDGNYAIVPASHSIRSLKGVLPGRAKPVSLEDMQAAVEAGARGA